MLKKDLRKKFKALRQTLPAPQLLYDSWAITARLLKEVAWQKYKALHIYLPMLQRHELNTYPLIHALWRDFPKLSINVPRVDMQTQTLENVLFVPETRLYVGDFGQYEPLDALPAPAREVEVAIVPLLAYSEAGYRVGYGKGHYDKFLPTCSADMLKIGISQFSPVAHIADTDGYDVRLDKVFTPIGSYDFG
jgi:5-formyltetrahydrofolate cyclo-ligase